MKEPSTLLAKRYFVALQKHVKEDSPASIAPALRLGRQTVAMSLETLDLARIHEQALVTLMLPGFSPKAQDRMLSCAGIFFAKANAPIEETHRTAQPSDVQWQELKKTLDLRTEELAVATARLRKELAQRKVMEAAYEKRAKLHDECLEESLTLQHRLRQLTHRLLAAQEDERKKISHELEDEIAQTLLAINVRLLALKHQASHVSEGFKDKLASTQRLVAKSARSVRQVVRKVGNP